MSLGTPSRTKTLRKSVVRLDVQLDIAPFIGALSYGRSPFIPKFSIGLHDFETYES